MVLASVAFEVKVRLQLRSMLIFFVFIRLLIESLRSPINNGSGGYLYGTGGLGFHLRDPSARLSYASTRPSGSWWLGYVTTLLNQRGTYLYLVVAGILPPYAMLARYFRMPTVTCSPPVGRTANRSVRTRLICCMGPMGGPYSRLVFCLCDVCAHVVRWVSRCYRSTPCGISCVRSPVCLSLVTALLFSHYYMVCGVLR